MSSLRQIWAVVEMNLRNLRHRLGGSLVIAFGVASSAGVLTSVLALGEGYARATAGGGSPDRATIVASGAWAETASIILAEKVPGIISAPGIARDSKGRPLAQPELLAQVQVPQRGGGRLVNLRLRGTGATVFSLRPEIHLTAGRMFRPGLHEVIVGRSAQLRYAGLGIGDRISFQHGDWVVVGTFAGAQPTVIESELFTDAQTLLSLSQRNWFHSVTARLENAGSLETLKRALKADPTLRVDVRRESDYARANSLGVRLGLDTLGAIIGGTLAVGALFGALNSLYTAVSARTLEIAQLRAIGFGAAPVLISVLCEALLLSLGGALVGTLGAWLLFSGRVTSMIAVGGEMAQTAFSMEVSPTLIAIGLLWGGFIGLAGGLLPALRAARMPVARALNAMI
jgi:putative ABC transport system permease protein